MVQVITRQNFTIMTKCEKAAKRYLELWPEYEGMNPNEKKLVRTFCAEFAGIWLAVNALTWKEIEGKVRELSQQQP